MVSGEKFKDADFGIIGVLIKLCTGCHHRMGGAIGSGKTKGEKNFPIEGV